MIIGNNKHKNYRIYIYIFYIYTLLHINYIIYKFGDKLI